MERCCLGDCEGPSNRAPLSLRAECVGSLTAGTSGEEGDGRAGGSGPTPLRPGPTVSSLP